MLHTFGHQVQKTHQQKFHHLPPILGVKWGWGMELEGLKVFGYAQIISLLNTKQRTKPQVFGCTQIIRALIHEADQLWRYLLAQPQTHQSFFQVLCPFTSFM
jgi:hypothetical protein